MSKTLQTKAASADGGDQFIADVVTAKLTGEDYNQLFVRLEMPHQLLSLMKHISEKVPGFTARFLIEAAQSPNLEIVWPRFVVWMLNNIALPSITVDKWGCREAIKRVVTLYESGSWQDKTATYAAAANANAAANATDATAAAYAAADATYAAAHAAAATAHAAAATAANAATYAAAAANAAATATATANKLMAVKLIELLRNPWK